MAENILDLLRDEATSLVESELPSSEEVRSVVGAIAQRLGRLEESVVGELKPAPAHEANVVAQPVEPTPYVPVTAQQAEPASSVPAVSPVASGVDEQLAQARAALQADQQRVAELEAQAAAPASPAAG